MISYFTTLSGQRRYWLTLITLGLALEAAALYYQYALDEWPCVLCIHIRIWILGFIVLGLIALALHERPWATRLAHGLAVVLMAGFVERSWRVLAVERGWVFGDCDMDAGLPAWFALDQWFPAVFEVQTACGYTPLILMNISMAEILMLLSSGLLLLAVILFVCSWSNQD